MWKSIIVLGSVAVSAVAADGKFALLGTPGELDVTFGGKVIARYQHAYDRSTPATLVETYKPYLHVFAADGTTLITKGGGGDYPHHRGIFIGWNRITFNGKTYDRWHMRGGEQVHQGFLAQQAGADHATFTSLVHWHDEAGQPFIVEERTLTFRPAPAPAHVMVDFTAKLTAPRGDVKLDGDPEHAGIHFRPANELDRARTLYVLPRENANAHRDPGYPWVGETFTLGGALHSVVAMSHPTNPKGTRWSAYRDYGRFGAFPTATIPAGGWVSFTYRFVIADGAMLPADSIQQSYNEFAGTTDETPKVTVVPAENKTAARKAEKKPAKKK